MSGVPCAIESRSLLVIDFKYSRVYMSILGFPGSSAGKESACNAGDPSSIPESRDALEKG